MYLAPIYSQGDGSPFQWANCGPAVCTELIDLCSVGAVRIPAPRIRKASGDTSGGIEGGLLAKTMNQLTGYLYPFLYRRRLWADLRDEMDHKSFGIIINCAKTVRTKYRTNSFTGTHWVTVAGGSVKDGTVKVEDPGTTYAGWLRWPLQLLREASDYAGGHYVLETPSTEDVDKHAVSAVAVFAKPDKASKRLGGLDKGEQIHVRKTTKGGPWLRADGTTAHGWHQVRFKGGIAYCKGESLR